MAGGKARQAGPNSEVSKTFFCPLPARLPTPPAVGLVST